MFEELLERIARHLARSGIRYMVHGGQAVLLYGEPRLTKDIDITLGVDIDRVADVLAMVSAAGLEPLVDAGDFVPQTMVLPCTDPASRIRVDFTFSNSRFESEALDRVRRVGIGKEQVCFTSLEDVVIQKVIAGRPRDLEDVTSILLKNPGIDHSYVRRWLEHFSDALAEPFTDVLDRLLEEGNPGE
jgi:predicted nucleotidyltransferase